MTYKLWAAMALATGITTAPVAAQEITLRVADMIPGTDTLASEGTRYFMEEVTRRTDGNVKFEYYPAQQLGKAKDMLNLLQSGLADIALIVPSYISEKFPLSGVMDLPGGPESSCLGTHLYGEMLEPGGWLAENEFSKQGVRKAFVYVNPPYDLFLAESELDLLNLDGAKLRAVAGAMDQTITQLGGVSVRMSAPDAREALSRGTIDGVVFPTPTVVTYQLESMIKSATRGARLASVATGYMISDAAWDKLPEDVKEVFAEVGAEASNRVCSAMDRKIDETYEMLETELKVNVVDVTDEQKRKLQPLFDAVRADWAKSLDDRGLPGTETLDALSQISATK